MKISECQELLRASIMALEAAPQKGFVDLDSVKQNLLKADANFNEILPQFETGIKLKEDFKNNLLSKLRVLRLSGDCLMYEQSEKALTKGDLGYDELKALQRDLEQAFEKIFGGLSGYLPGGRSTKIEDYH